MPAPALATIAGLAIASGVDVESIKHYHEAGLLPPSRRIAGRNARRGYHLDHLQRLKFIRRARNMGFSLEAIGQLLGVKGGMVTCGDALRVASRHLDAIRAELADPKVAADPDRSANLAAIERLVAPLIEHCSGNGATSSCQVLRTLSAP
jgi:DNA-binding transcriptional MerR regulator